MLVNIDKRQHAQSGMARQDGLGHGAHAHRLRAQQAQHADLGRGLELRAEHPGVDALVQRDALSAAHAQAAVARRRRRRPCRRSTKRSLPASSCSGVRWVMLRWSRQHHQAARPHGRVQAAGGVGQQQHAHAQLGQVRMAPFMPSACPCLIGVLATRQHRHLDAADAAHAQRARVPGDAHLREMPAARGRRCRRRPAPVRQRPASPSPSTIATTGRAGATPRGDMRSATVRSRRSCQMLRAEARRQQLAQREAAAQGSSCRRPGPAPRRRANSRSFWRQPPQGVTSSGPAPTTATARMRCAAGQHQLADGHRLGTQALRVRRVLDVAAGVDAALLVEQSRADRELRIRRMRMLASEPCRGKQCGDAICAERVHGDDGGNPGGGGRSRRRRWYMATGTTRTRAATAAIGEPIVQFNDAIKPVFPRVWTHRNPPTTQRRFAG